MCCARIPKTGAPALSLSPHRCAASGLDHVVRGAELLHFCSLIEVHTYMYYVNMKMGHGQKRGSQRRSLVPLYSIHTNIHSVYGGGLGTAKSAKSTASANENDVK